MRLGSGGRSMCRADGRKRARRTESRAAPFVPVPVPDLSSGSLRRGSEGALFMSTFVFALGGAFEGEVDKKSCGCGEGTAESGISAGFVVGAGVGIDGVGLAPAGWVGAGEMAQEL